MFDDHDGITVLDQDVAVFLETRGWESSHERIGARVFEDALVFSG